MLLTGVYAVWRAGDVLAGRPISTSVVWVGRAVHQVPGATRIQIDTIDDLDDNSGKRAGQPPDSDPGDHA